MMKKSKKTTAQVAKVVGPIVLLLQSISASALNLVGANLVVDTKFVKTSESGSNNSCAGGTIWSSCESSFETFDNYTGSINADYVADIDAVAYVKYKINELSQVPTEIYCAYTENQTRSFDARGFISWGEPMYGPYPYTSLCYGGKGRGKYTLNLGTQTATAQVSIIGGIEEGYGRGNNISPVTSGAINILIELARDGLPTTEIVGGTVYYKQKFKYKSVDTLGTAALESESHLFDILWANFYNGGSATVTLTKGLTSEVWTY